MRAAVKVVVARAWMSGARAEWRREGLRDSEGRSRAMGGERVRSRQLRAREQQEIRREDRRAYVGVKATRAFPDAAREAEDALQQ